jgi:hypothetical protein
MPLDRRLFDSVDAGRIQPVRRLRLGLDTAQSVAIPLEIGVAGSFIYVDNDSTGKVYLRFNEQLTDDRMPAQAGFSVDGFPIRSVYVDWTAQIGKVVNLWYGLDGRISPKTDSFDVGFVDRIDNLPVKDANQHFFKMSSGFGTEYIGSYGTAAAYARAVFVAAVAAQNSYFQLWNPVGSGAYLFLYSLRISTPSASPVFVNADNVELIAGTQFFGRDLRNLATNSLEYIRAGTNAGVPTGINIWQQDSGAGNAREMVPPGYYARIPQGFGLAAYFGTVNISGRFDATWATNQVGN